MHIVDLTKVRKTLKKVPVYIADKVHIWADMAEKRDFIKCKKFLPLEITF